MAANSKERRDQLSVTLDPELRSRLEQAAQQARRSLSNQAAFFLAQALAESRDEGRVAA
jgi:hypothetical protein